nr:nickel-dependent lactate racemase [uncultured Caproiciproducens sp.]
MIANGLHRKMTQDEKIEKLGSNICDKFRVVNHDASDESMLCYVGKLSTGTPLYINKRLVESDLVISEGFIEPHFFAGFSGGRKSILPGVAGAETIMSNHCPKNIANPSATTSSLHHNPIHQEMLEAMRLSSLKFILNVALDSEKHIIAAFAGHPELAHLRGCEYVKKAMSVPCHPAPIVVTSNDGYSLDRNMYQLVKGIDTACKAATSDGVIIMVARCADGVGHKEYYKLIRSYSNVEELYEGTRNGASEVDKWQVQVLARILRQHRVILVSDGVNATKAKDFFFDYASSPEEALKKAYAIKEQDARVNVIPDGPVVIPEPIL